MTPLSHEDAATFGVHQHPGFHLERGPGQDEYEPEDIVLQNPAHPDDFREGWPEQKAAILRGGIRAIAKLLDNLFMVDSRAKSKSGEAYTAHVLKWKLDDLLGPAPAAAATARGHALVEGFHRMAQGLARGVELIPTPPDTPILEAEEIAAPPPLILGPPRSPGSGGPGSPRIAAPPSVRKLQKRRRPANENDFGGGGKRRRTKRKAKRRRRITSKGL